MDARKELDELLADFFGIGSPDGSYHYTLKRAKEAFDLGTMGLDDFEEYDEETVAEIGEHLIAAGVTIQRWIPMTERPPTAADTSEDGEVLCCTEVNQFVDAWPLEDVLENPEWFTHWMPMPKPPKEDNYG